VDRLAIAFQRIEVGVHHPFADAKITLQRFTLGRCNDARSGCGVRSCIAANISLQKDWIHRENLGKRSRILPRRL
jgi:hypothetical protein